MLRCENEDSAAPTARWMHSIHSCVAAGTGGQYKSYQPITDYIFSNDFQRADFHQAPWV
jgi:hypothetical protein